MNKEDIQAARKRWEAATKAGCPLCTIEIDANGNVTHEPGCALADLPAALDALEAAQEAVSLLLQAFDPCHPAACKQDCFNFDNGHGYEVQEGAKARAYAILGESE